MATVFFNSVQRFMSNATVIITTSADIFSCQKTFIRSSHPPLSPILQHPVGLTSTTTTRRRCHSNTVDVTHKPSGTQTDEKMAAVGERPLVISYYHLIRAD